MAWMLAALPAAALDIPHESFTLDNGLEVVLIPDKSLPKVVVDLWYDVGSLDDPQGRSGFAHLFEHLMFKGTARVGEGQFDAHMEATGGANNASTGDERTNYYDFGPKTALDLYLWLEADRMTGLAITQAKLDVEREVVRNERRQNYEDAPYGAVWLEVPKLMFPPEHPLSRSGIGEHAELMAASLDDVQAFYETWYVPSNAVLAIAGDFEPADARAWVHDTFGRLPARPKPTRTLPEWPDAPAGEDVVLRDDVSLAATVQAWHSAPLYAAGDAELDVLSAILTGSEDGRLVKRLVYEDRIAQEVQAVQLSSRWGSLFIVQAHVAPGHTIEEVDAVIAEELAAIAGDRPPTADELERAVNGLEVEKLYRAESLMGRAELLQSYRMHVGRYDWLGEDLARYRRVTPDSVVREASRLVPERRGRVHVLPEEESTE